MRVRPRRRRRPRSSSPTGRGGPRASPGPRRRSAARAVRVRHARGTVEQAAGRLDALSPLACLERGYAIVRRGDSTGPVVRAADALAAGDAVALVFARGRARARIEGTEPEKEP